jgi:hypothetical protein
MFKLFNFIFFMLFLIHQQEQILWKKQAKRESRD